jgi:acetyl-CoA acetyltransferase
MTFSYKPVVIGIGESQEVGVVPGKIGLDHAVEASVAAIRDAGLSPRDIDGVFTEQGASDYRHLSSAVLAEYLGITPAYTNWIPYGGVSTPSILGVAVAAISAGLCSTALIASGDTLRSGLGRSGTVSKLAMNAHPDFEAPYGPHIVSQYAMAGQRHMHEFNTTRADFAEVAVAARYHASLNPRAQMRSLITVEDVLESRAIATPFHLLDCALISDGGAALVLTSADLISVSALQAVNVAACVDLGTQMYVSEAATLTTNATKLAANRAYEMSGLKPADVDVAFPYDNFTCMVIIALEDLGFCAKGEGGDFVKDGRIRLGGELPLNPHGGLLSFAHPGRSLFAATEAVRQLRGDSGERQVPNAKVALWHGYGGIFSSASVNLFAV